MFKRLTGLARPLCLSALAFMASFSSTAMAASATSLDNFKLTILTENYPPFNMSVADKNFARDNQIDGISTDIVREMMSRAKIDYTMTLRFPWSKVYDLAVNSKDFAVFSTARLPERESKFKWVGPLIVNKYKVFAMSDKKVNLKTLKDLNKYKVVSVKGHAVTNLLKKSNIQFEKNLKEDANAHKLSRGQADLWVTGEFSGYYYAQKEGIPTIKPVFEVGSTNDYLALNPSVPDDVVNRLQAALNSMNSDGTVERIFSNYR
ncbi:substrate-binding periplasmic protein [Endozoicomonas ascidiicola]|uniref:substrate-binding periplasmic protein n=1 Tax=Endozoicomonas ascidiicola TaxID=1698521 RepID=UPI0008338372|nr:ABC transporter substrate-binding protein [Endozoicomonas ascidiicola]